jgi:hypothetical protein
LALLVAAAWIGLGAVLRNGARLDAGLARRAGALVLGVFALLVGGSAFSA